MKKEKEKEKMTMKKMVIFMLTIILIFSATACKTSPQEPTEMASSEAELDVTQAPEENMVPEEHVTLTLLMPGAEPATLSELMGPLNEILTKEINAELEVIYVPWDQYDSKRDMMTAAGQGIDGYWLHSSQYSEYVSKKYVADVTDLMKEYGKDLVEIIPEENLGPYMIDGRLYTIPAKLMPSASDLGYLLYRADIADELGFTSDDLETFDDFLNFARQVKSTYPEMVPISGGADYMIDAYLREGSGNLVSLGYLPTLFAVDASTDDDTVISILETEQFEGLCNFMKTASMEGLIPEDALTNRNSLTRIEDGRTVIGPGSQRRAYEKTNNLIQNAPEGVFEVALIHPEKPTVKTSSTSDTMAISSVSQNPERMMMFYNWIFKSAENYRMVFYGLEGTHYNVVDDRLVKLNGSKFLHEWQMQNVNYIIFEPQASDEFIESQRKGDVDALISKSFGFSFNGESVKAETAKINAVYNEMIIPMMYGALDYDEYYDIAMEKLKDAGLDTVQAEIQKQFTEFMNNN